MARKTIKDAPWKYQPLADAMLEIRIEDECNDTYGRIRMFQALHLKQPEGVQIPGERTVYHVMEGIDLNHKPKCKPNGITKAGREARKSEDFIKRDFTAEKPLLYERYDTATMTVEQLKTLIWRYFISYWNNRRICSANGGLPPMVKRLTSIPEMFHIFNHWHKPNIIHDIVLKTQF